MSVPIQIVDENDQPVGQATKQEAWQQGLIHRVVRIMLEDGKGNVLLQHRDPSKDIFPDCWDNSSAGHVDAGEDYETAAYRELEEELGLTGIQLEELGSYRTNGTWHGKQLNRFVRCYHAHFDGMPERLEQGTIDDMRWFSLEDAQVLTHDHPESVSDGLQEVMERFYSK